MTKQSKFIEIMMKFVDTQSFNEVWDGFVSHHVVDSDLTMKQICSLFFGWGIIDMIKKVHKDEIKEAMDAATETMD